MRFYYADQSGNTRQIEADSYRRIENGNQTVVRYSHDMNSGPYDQTFSGAIITINSLGGTWLPNPTQAPRACLSSPAYQGNRIYDDFDAPYGDNSGTCVYDVTISLGCKTDFYLNGAIVLSLNYCPTIEDDPRNKSCDECCKELLSLARSIRI